VVVICGRPDFSKVNLVIPPLVVICAHQEICGGDLPGGEMMWFSELVQIEMLHGMGGEVSRKIENYENSMGL
jgi:hypothetical protein